MVSVATSFQTWVPRSMWGVFCLLVLPVSAQVDYTEDLSLFASLNRVQVRADYGLYSGWSPWGVGAALHGFYDSADEEEFGGLIFAGHTDGETALRIGGGYQQRDAETGSSPVVDLRWVRKFDPFADLQLYGQNELDGAGLGVGIRFHFYAEVTSWMDINVLLDASYFEEIEEDLDGYASILIEPFRGMDMIHVGPAVSLDEDEVEVGLLFLIAN